MRALPFPAPFTPVSRPDAGRGLAGRLWPLACLALTLGGLALPDAAAQQQIPGRFVVAVDQGTAVLVDSSTGESWVYTVGSAGWQEIDFPLPDGRRQRLPPTDRAYQR